MNRKDSFDCIMACYTCSTMCEYCAGACLKDEEVSTLIRCIELDRQCAVMCRSAAEVMAVGSQQAEALCQLCASACDACAEECEMHAAKMDHCRECAEACRKCAQECRAFASVSQSIH